MRTNIRILALVGTNAAIIPQAFDNDFTALIPHMYSAMRVVSREMVGYIPGVSRDAAASGVSLGQQVEYDIVGTPTITDVTPSMTTPTPPDQTVDTGTIEITSVKKTSFKVTGDEEDAVDMGPGYLSIQAQNIAQSLRVLVNAIEQEVANATIAAASRAYGTPGTTPFATNLEASAEIRRILDANGAPLTGRSLVIEGAAGAKMRTLQQLTKANEAGTQMTLRDGMLLDIHGHVVRESAANTSHAKGTAASATTTAAGFAIGATVIALASAGTGTILAGDVITFAGDANKYVVVSGDADVSNGGSVTIAAPGLLVAIPASATAITVSNSYVAGAAFSSNAVQLLTRIPKRPSKGDLATEVRVLTDPRSGLSFEFSRYAGYRMNAWEVAIAWGVGVPQPEHIALMLG